jgi:hypothetical protein
MKMDLKIGVLFFLIQQSLPQDFMDHLETQQNRHQLLEIGEHFIIFNLNFFYNNKTNISENVISYHQEVEDWH